MKVKCTLTFFVEADPEEFDPDGDYEGSVFERFEAYVDDGNVSPQELLSDWNADGDATIKLSKS